jgi:hypothetical protein
MRLIRLSVEAAAVPVIVASVKLALVYSCNDNRHLFFCVLLGRLYANVCAVLAALTHCENSLYIGICRP